MSFTAHASKGWSRTSYEVETRHRVQPREILKTKPRLEIASSPPISGRIHPWRYRIGQFVRIWGSPPEEAFEILGGELAGKHDWPHYWVESNQGRKFLIAQIMLTSKING